jgi:sirohydrochlorin ferrochelatase
MGEDKFMKTGTIILGHGSKAPQALATLKQVQELVKESSKKEIVEIASLQFDKPDISEAIANVVSQGVSKIVLVPLFLYFGIHLQEDIPAILDEEKAKYPNVEFVMTDNLGADKRIIDIVVDRIEEAS